MAAGGNGADNGDDSDDGNDDDGDGDNGEKGDDDHTSDGNDETAINNKVCICKVGERMATVVDIKLLNYLNNMAPSILLLIIRTTY